LPDKAIDLIDEAASALRLSLENKPPQLEEAHRKITRLEIEKEALKKEAEEGVEKAQTRVRAIEKEVADLRDGTRELELKWKNEKETLTEIKEAKSELERARLEADAAEARGDLTKTAEVRYAKIPTLEKEIEVATKRLKKLQLTRRVLREDITGEDIAGVVSRWTGVPVSRMLEEEAEKLSRMDEELKKRIVGQDEAVQKIADAIRRSRAGIADPHRPVGSFLFLGPTGVGKTELTKALASFLFNSDSALVVPYVARRTTYYLRDSVLFHVLGHIDMDEGGITVEKERGKGFGELCFAHAGGAQEEE
jgi:ATP-dependent Clp protease ATP-binding subunit ClpB